jgi:hypothetical protein
MSTQISATVVGGMLKPDQTLSLADHTRVKLTIEALEEKPTAREAWESLKPWIQEHPLHGLGRRLTRDERRERR